MPLERTERPPEGAEGVPIDAAVRVFFTGGYPDPLKRAIAEEYRLRGPDGEVVSLTGTQTRNRLDLESEGPLQPDTEYTLERVYGFDGGGVRLDDRERWRWAKAEAAPNGARRRVRRGREPPETVRRAWFPISTFRTGSGDPERSLSAPEIASADWAFAYGGGDCGPAVAVDVEFEAPDGVRPSDVVELVVEGRGVVATKPAVRNGEFTAHIGASDFLCNPDPVYLEYDPERRFRVRYIGAGGRRLTQSEGTSPKGRPSRMLGSQWTAARQKKRKRSRTVDFADEAVGAWLESPEVEGEISGRTGPESCKHGFRSEGRQEVSGPGGNGEYESYGPVGWSGDRGWVVISPPDTEAIDLVEVREGVFPSRRRLDSVPRAEVSAVGADGVYVVSVDYGGDEPSPATLHAFDFSGESRWSREIGPGWTRHAVVVDDGRVLVAWAWEKGTNDYRLAWSLYDAASGERIAHRVTSRQIDGKGVDAVRTDDGIAVSYIEKGGAERRAAIALLRDGEEVHRATLDVRTRNYVDIGSDGRHLAVAVPRAKSDVEVSFFDTRGRQLAPSVIANRGVGSGVVQDLRVAWIETGASESAAAPTIGGGPLSEMPFDRLVAPSRGYFAVAWRASSRVYATAVDLYGNVAPATPVRDGSPAHAPAFADTGDGPVVSYVGAHEEGYPVFAEFLGCRDEPRVGVPQRIQPMR